MILFGVIGDGQCGPETYRIAEEVGEEIARRGIGLVCGSLTGVMEAACRGAKAAGGLTVGIVPGDDPASANRFVEIPIATGMGEARNIIVIKSSRAVIAVEGRYGTLSEIAFALKLERPLVGIRTWELSRRGQRDNGIVYVDTAREAVEKAVVLAGLKQ